MNDIKIRINNLFKIFGPEPKQCMQYVKQGITKQELLEKHGHVVGLRDINIDVPEKKIQVIMGLSGSGKSTLIRHINRLIEPTEGEVVVDGMDVLDMGPVELRNFRRHKASMVFQRFALMPHRTVIQNVAYGLTIQNINRDESKERSQHWIDRVGLTGFEKHYPAQLSGGMQQRVGLARALATDAELLLMDEAFSALDPLIRTDMQEILLDLQSELQKTILFITHDLDEALKIGDQIAILRDGEVVQQGSSQEIVLHPVDDYISDFVKDVNRARVLQASSIMTNAVDSEDFDVPFDMPLEELLQRLSEKEIKSAGVIDKNGDIIGKVELAAAIKAVARPDREGTVPQYR